jgi:hypothetical protein
MGTPHYGSELASLLSMAERMVSWALLRRPESTNLSKELLLFSNTLTDINHEFRDIAKHIIIVSFYEQKQTRLPGTSAFVCLPQLFDIILVILKS